jgi:hypothetical protein
MVTATSCALQEYMHNKLPIPPFQLLRSMFPASCLRPLVHPSVFRPMSVRYPVRGNYDYKVAAVGRGFGFIAHRFTVE